ncbi:hypothetical protein BKD30_03915 [Tersicoccus phoenicis]|uniref:Fis family transcriptional regulator n=1 Tax=Tersicoccus phoenicis TaxID=554083 RepID=A0A1R1LHM8_9MICC|nr:hypothetical protein [Tersicoccus phoenicis]OMH27045.1 hypothetical protein BKD30_03915 [Tersicoccus phoenicis]
MRWDALFEDLQSQWSTLQDRVRESEIAERTRLDHLGVTLAGRLRASTGRRVRVLQDDGETIDGILGFTGADWTCLRSGTLDVIVVASWCRSWEGLHRAAVPTPSALSDRLTLASALRGLSRDRAVVTLSLATGPGSTAVRGRIERVGRDFLDVTPVHPGELRPDRAGVATTVPMTACVRISSLGR